MSVAEAVSIMGLEGSRWRFAADAVGHGENNLTHCIKRGSIFGPSTNLAKCKPLISHNDIYATAVGVSGQKLLSMPTRSVRSTSASPIPFDHLVAVTKSTSWPRFVEQ